MRSETTGDISYYFDCNVQGTPLLLLHSINAAPSAIEMKPLFDYFRKYRPVYAPDLPGFDFSDRSDRTYGRDLYKSAIIAFQKK
jgi:pimeloyl-ACP methyl ester carboxylesterase